QNDNDSHERSLMMIRSLTHNVDSASRLTAIYEDLFTRHFGLETRLVASTKKVNKHNAAWLILTGWKAHELANIEQGTHLFYKSGKYLSPVQIKVFAIGEDQQPREAIKAQLKQARRWLLELTRNNSPDDGVTWPIDPVIRLYTEDEAGI